MAVVEVKKGFYAFLFGKDCFMETDQVKKSRKLARTFLNGIQEKRGTNYDIFDGDIDYMMYAMESATLEIKYSARGKWIDIHGETWGGHGPDGFFPMDSNPLETDRMIYIEGK